jgi:hypothetical protein
VVVVSVSIAEGPPDEPTAADAVGKLQSLHTRGELQQALAAGGITDVLDEVPELYFTLSPPPAPPPAPEPTSCDCDDADASDECKETCDTISTAVGIVGGALIAVIVAPIAGFLLVVALIVVCICCCCCKGKKAAGAPAQPTAVEITKTHPGLQEITKTQV